MWCKRSHQMLVTRKFLLLVPGLWPHFFSVASDFPPVLSTNASQAQSFKMAAVLDSRWPPSWSGRQAICIIYIIISLRKGMLYLWFILLRNRTIPKHYLSPRESVGSIQVYMYSRYIICVIKERD